MKVTVEDCLTGCRTRIQSDVEPGNGPILPTDLFPSCDHQLMASFSLLVRESPIILNVAARSHKGMCLRNWELVPKSHGEIIAEDDPIGR